MTKSPASRTDADAARGGGGRTVDDLTRANVRAMRQLEEGSLHKRGVSERIAAAVARFCGTMAFAYLHVAFFSGWIAINTLPGMPRFDPYPFTFLTLVVSLEAIFLSTFILISQNVEMRVNERRAQLDLQINLLSEQENTKMLALLERIAQHVGAIDRKDPEIVALKQAVQPERLLEQIEDACRPGEPPAPERPSGA